MEFRGGCEKKIINFFLVFQCFIGRIFNSNCKTDLIAEPTNTEKLIVMMRSQMPTPEEITSSDREVIAFLAQNEKIMEQVDKMESYLRATQDLEALLKITREAFINELIDYYLEHNEADSFFSSGYKEFIVK